MQNRIKLLRNLLEDLRHKHPSISDEWKYIGTGNPLADILIIGKEASISMENNAEQYQNEIINNYPFWYDQHNFDQNLIPSNIYSHNPLYPYKGQQLKRDNKQNGGTSTTWMNYQKLINNIHGLENNQVINFHKYAFITEVNSTPSKKTKDAKTDSIPFRKEHVLSSGFFNDFPIIIVAGVRYFRHGVGFNELGSIFKVHFELPEHFAGENKKQPYWIHWNDPRTKLLINTYQMSQGISTELLKKVAEVVKTRDCCAK